jgi:hypothetical protein
MPACTSATFPSSAATTLAKLRGMLGSDHAGERAAAALKADQLVCAQGLTWRDIAAAPKQSSPAQHKPQQTNDDDDDWCACGTSSTATAATPKASSASASKSGSSSLFQLGHLVAL